PSQDCLVWPVGPVGQERKRERYNIDKKKMMGCVEVMMGGFVHGVLNTDNINISGELFDYGPYRFLPKYDPQFTAAYFDRQGLYCFGRQPASFLWALHQLGASLKIGNNQFEFEKVLEAFSEKFTQHVQTAFLKRLNLKPRGNEENSQLLSAFFQMLSKTDVLFEQAFFDFNSKRILSQTDGASARLDLFSPDAADFIRLLDTYEIADQSAAKHSYFENEKPCTLLIDEIEAIWSPIAEKDDWSLFENKLQAIRQIRS
ncbi:MAG: protein adenylyltransferase SelO family protein, partial [Bdellovibrionaceae bacterium]|nr:protein adenylyltransferase SelO family protein [Pseudobdellovibrionaceae bacterium]